MSVPREAYSFLSKASARQPITDAAFAAATKQMKPAKREIPDRNASERIEPRNYQHRKWTTVFIYWKSTSNVSRRQRRETYSFPGSETAVWY